MPRAAGQAGAAQTDTADRAAGRQSLVWQLLLDALFSVAAPGHVPGILDCGGGSGTFAVPLASAGADVTVVDISADALATLTRRADEAAVADLVHPVQGDVEALSDAVGARSFDLVLAHGILEAIDDVGAAFDAVVATMRPGGLLSVLVGNPVAAVLGRALGGDPAAALSEFRGLSTGFGRLGPDGVAELCRGAGLLVESRHGIGVFTELVPGAALDAPGARETLEALEIEASARAPFVDIASRVHLLARKPQSA